MEYLKIRNWEKWQSYRSDRSQPPWIKIHRCVMRNPEWVSLTDAERGQLVAIWLLAADHNGSIPDSKTIVQQLCYMTKTPNLNKFIELGFIDANMTPQRRQDDANMTHQTRLDKTRQDKTREEIWSEFEQFWQAYPKKTGKQYAKKCWEKAKSPPIDKLLASLERQKESQQWKKNKGQFIPNPATWINQGRWDDELPKEEVSTFFDDFDSDERMPS